MGDPSLHVTNKSFVFAATCWPSGATDRRVPGWWPAHAPPRTQTSEDAAVLCGETHENTTSSASEKIDLLFKEATHTQWVHGVPHQARER